MLDFTLALVGGKHLLATLALPQAVLASIIALNNFTLLYLNWYNLKGKRSCLHDSRHPVASYYLATAVVADCCLVVLLLSAALVPLVCKCCIWCQLPNCAKRKQAICQNPEIPNNFELRPATGPHFAAWPHYMMHYLLCWKHLNYHASQPIRGAMTLLPSAYSRLSTFCERIQNANGRSQVWIWFDNTVSTRRGRFNSISIINSYLQIEFWTVATLTNFTLKTKLCYNCIARFCIPTCKNNHYSAICFNELFLLCYFYEVLF